jgi:hypothetical protein
MRILVLVIIECFIEKSISNVTLIILEIPFRFEFPIIIIFLHIVFMFYWILILQIIKANFAQVHCRIGKVRLKPHLEMNQTR